ncbi:hypothetical protein E4H12_08605 [Candidatus Thorarchaeota archaeon]|nr:MAG: hypothetical protein E4H12_08605 [Candidatus Thorarchaeota archaeon]
MSSKRQNTFVVATVLLLVSSLSNFNTLETTANPIVMHLKQTYGYLVLDSNMSMPEAFVNFTIERTHTEGLWYEYDIRMNAIYTFQSPITQVATIGLVCPQEWSSGDADIEISDDHSTLPYVIRNYTELVSENETQTASWIHLDFVIFNCTLEIDTPTDISIVMDLGTSEAENAFQFYYFVATAHAWSGDTHEVIIMNVKNLDGTSSCSFSPDTSLTITNNPPWRTATWELNMSAFEKENVSLSIYHERPLFEGNEFLLIFVAVTVPIIIILIVALIRGRK